MNPSEKRNQRPIFEDTARVLSEFTRGENPGETLLHRQVARYISTARKLNPANRYLIGIAPDWQLENIGVAALVTTDNESYTQDAHTPIAA